MVVAPTKRRFTVDEYYRMAEAGILRPDERVELVEGEIIRMAPIGGWHAKCVNFLAKWAILILGERALVSIQNPVRLSLGSEPEPDIAIVRPDTNRPADAHPGPHDVLLIIEVADTSLRYDRQIKMPLYAAASIPEAWIVDIDQRQILVHRSPRDGIYQQTFTVGRDGTAAPQASLLITRTGAGMGAAGLVQMGRELHWTDQHHQG